jgi:hypothetical protein
MLTAQSGLDRIGVEFDRSARCRRLGVRFTRLRRTSDPRRRRGLCAAVPGRSQAATVQRRGADFRSDRGRSGQHGDGRSPAPVKRSALPRACQRQLLEERGCRCPAATSSWSAGAESCSACIPHSPVHGRPQVSSHVNPHRQDHNEERYDLRGVWRSTPKATAGLEPATPSLRGSDPPSHRFGSAPSFRGSYAAFGRRVIPHLFRNGQGRDACHEVSRLQLMDQVLPGPR